MAHCRRTRRRRTSGAWTTAEPTAAQCKSVPRVSSVPPRLTLTVDLERWRARPTRLGDRGRWALSSSTSVQFDAKDCVSSEQGSGRLLPQETPHQGVGVRSGFATRGDIDPRLRATGETTTPRSRAAEVAPTAARSCDRRRCRRRQASPRRQAPSIPGVQCGSRPRV